MIRLYNGTHNNHIVMGDNGSTPMWISEDGDYGLTPITLFDAHYWKASDFEQLDSAPASERVALAQAITDEILCHKENDIEAFLDDVRERALQLGIRMFHLTEQGMDEIV
jgi:hypothetical protein